VSLPSSNSAGANTAAPIAVVGLSALFPGSVHRQAFWRNIVAGRDFITDVPPDHWLVEDYYDPDPTKPGKIYAKRGAFLPKVPFNPLEFGLPPKNLPATDSVQLLALLGAKQLLQETRSFQAGTAPRERTSVVLGVAAGTELIGEMAAKIQRPHWVEALRREGIAEDKVEQICQRIFESYPDWTENTFPGLLANVTAGRIANRFDLGGTNCVVDAACASSLAAITLAVDELRLGKSDLVITGGADALSDIFMFTCFTRTPAMSFTGDCRPFSDAADGTLLGEGIGLFALRRLADAERDGDVIYGLIRGIGSSSDGSSKSIYAPRPEGQSAAIRRALAEAGCRPEDIELIEAHGTATKAGDAAEFEGLRRAFSDGSAPRDRWCALGSIKSQIGHTKSAAGAAGLFKALLALRQGVLPPTIKVDRPNPALSVETSPFYVNTAARPWVHAPATPRRAGLSSFGFGGSNYHLTLEEYRGPQAAPRIAQDPTVLVLASAADPDALLARLRELADAPAALPVEAVARQSWTRFSATAAHRVALLAQDRASLSAHAARLVNAIAASSGQAVRIDRVGHYASGPAEPGGVAFLFPGQGSQYLNMGAELATEFEPARAVWDRFATSGATPLHRVVFPPPAFTDRERQVQGEVLVRTEHAQPALGLVALAQLALLDRVGLKPTCVAGHSYGELVALHVAGAIPDPATMVRLSEQRGALMADVAGRTPGAMTAVLGSAAEVAPHLIDGVVIANHNSPRQVVVSGPTDAVAAFEQQLAARGGPACKRLPVATAFHSPLVAPAADRFAAVLAPESLAAPKLPVYANVTGEPYPDSPAAVADLISRQLASPVMFQQSIEAMHAAGARLFIEVGPGQVLTRLVGQILVDRPHTALAIDARPGDGVAALLEVLGRLAVAGLPLDLAALYAGFESAMPDPTVGPQPRGVVLVNGTNLGKPYPPANGAAGRTPPVPPLSEPASVPVPTPAMSTPHHAPNGDSLQRLALFEQIQRNMLEAQRHFQETLAQTHLAFLQTSESLIRQLGGTSLPDVHLNGNGNGHAHANGHGNGNGHAHLTVPAPLPRSAPPLTPVVMSPPPAPVVMTPPPSRVAAPQPVVSTPILASAAPAPQPAPALVTSPAAATPNYQDIIVGTIAELTGYPVEMIELDMELEAGLGIDSIKKVEIFSALQAKIPAYAGIDTGKVATLTTPRAILAFTHEITGGGPEKN
jgi:polyketide-type polyunsaturated fatty acid synthase PfaA